MSKILDDLKTVCTGVEKDDSFNEELTILASGGIATLIQNGAGFEDFVLTAESTWDDFLGPEAVKTPIYGCAKDYLLLFTRTLFDPPVSSVQKYVSSVMEEMIWRVNVATTSLLEEGGVINGKPVTK